MTAHSGDSSSHRAIDATANDDLALDKETLKDLDAPSSADVAGQLGEKDTAWCVTASCFTCMICTITATAAKNA